jgi:hypothetical protein
MSCSADLLTPAGLAVTAEVTVRSVLARIDPTRYGMSDLGRSESRTTVS